MRIITPALAIILLFPFISFSQSNYMSTNFNEALKNAQVVLLGEPDHFSTTEMNAKLLI